MKKSLIKHFVFEKGREFSPQVMKDMPRLPLHQCFDNCALMALQSSLDYVEGVVKVPTTGQWIYHAWLTDGIHAFDPTWQAKDKEGKEVAFPGTYVGIKMDKRLVADFMRRTGYQGVLRNDFRCPSVFKKIVA